MVRQILDNARQFEVLCMSDAERNGLHGLIDGLESRVDQIVDAQRRVRHIPLFMHNSTLYDIYFTLQAPKYTFTQFTLNPLRR